MQSTTLCWCASSRCNRETVLLPWQDKAHISMDEYTQHVRFNMHKFWLFTAGQWRCTMLSDDKSRLDVRLGWVPTTHNLIFSLLTMRRKALSLSSRWFFCLIGYFTSLGTAVAKWLTFWCRNYFFFLNFSTLCILNVNNTGTKYVRIMKQTAFWREKYGEYILCLKYSVPIIVE